MDPFKTGLFATALVSWGKSGRFPLTQRVSSQWHRFNQLLDGQKLPKNVYGESVLTQIAKIKMTGSIIGPVRK